MPTALDADPKFLDKHERNFIAKIREHGWFGTHVFEDKEGPGFSYTTGFWATLAFPDLISFSLKDSVLQGIFWNIFDAAKAGADLSAKRRISEILVGNDVVLLPVDKLHYREFLGWSRWFYGGDQFPTLQVVWPDQDNRFPWEPDVAAEFIQAQPDLTRGFWDGLAAGH